VWLLMMNNGGSDNPDPTTRMLRKVLPESLPVVQCWQSAKVETCLLTR
jgi:hypothetical protein